MRLSVVTMLALLLAALDAAPVPTDAAGATKPAWSIWSSAKHFFKIQSNITAKKSAATASPTASAMPTSFGIQFKHVHEFYCKNVANAGKPFCANPITPSSTKPKFSEMREAFKFYCADPTHKNDVKICKGGKPTFSLTDSAAPAAPKPTGTKAKVASKPKASKFKASQ